MIVLKFHMLLLYIYHQTVSKQCFLAGAAPQGGQGGDRPPKGFKKGKILKYGVFSCIKISFSDIFNKEIHALRALLSRF